MTRESLYPRVHAWPNLLSAYGKAARGKRGRRAAASFEIGLSDRLVAIRDALRDKIYRPGSYHSFWIHDPKKRLISAAEFRDRVVHHALCNVIEPIFERRFVADSFANRKGKGTHLAVDRCQEFARRYRYVLPCDVRQHFPALDHQVLLGILARIVRDPDVLELCRRILESGVGILDSAYDMVYFPGDDLFAISRDRGLPIGNLTSQFWSNCYLDPFDHFVKRELRCPAYVRYVDDLLLFGDCKKTLWAWKRAVVERLASVRLTIHEERAQVQPVAAGIPWLGFVVYPTHRRVKRRNVVRFRRRLAHLVARFERGELSFEALQASIRGWVEHVRYADSWGLRSAILSTVRLGPWGERALDG